MFLSPPLPPPAGTGRAPRERARAAPHLRAALNGMGVGLLTFSGTLEVLFANDRLAATLEIQPVVVDRAMSLLDVLEGSAVLAPAAVQRVHEACLAAVAAPAAALLAPVGAAAALPALQFLLGCHARDLLRRALGRRGYAEAHVVLERDGERALARLIAERPELASAWGRAALA